MTSLASAKDAGGRPAPVVDVGTKLAWHAGGTPHLLWTGFRAKSDGGEVLIQTSAEVDLETRTEKDGPVFVLKGCKVLRRTDQLPLETQFFDSPVTRVSMKRRSGDLEIAVSLRQPVTAVPRKEAGPGGSWFWVLAFPAPGRAATAAPTPPRPTPPRSTTPPLPNHAAAPSRAANAGPGRAAMVAPGRAMTSAAPPRPTGSTASRTVAAAGSSRTVVFATPIPTATAAAAMRTTTATATP